MIRTNDISWSCYIYNENLQIEPIKLNIFGLVRLKFVNLIYKLKYLNSMKRIIENDRPAHILY